MNAVVAIMFQKWAHKERCESSHLKAPKFEPERRSLRLMQRVIASLVTTARHILRNLCFPHVFSHILWFGVMREVSGQEKARL